MRRFSLAGIGVLTAAVGFVSAPVVVAKDKTENTDRAEKSAKSSNPISGNCTYKGKKLQGKVQITSSFPDFKVQQVSSFADLHVQLVDSFPSDCGKWQIVDSHPDFTIEYVTSFPDFKIKMVSSFPGVQ